MTAIQALILGVVQGLGEFLPISSSGHLVLLQKIFGIREGAMSFDIFVHLGTLISLCIVMRKRLLEYLREPLGYIPKMVLLGTVPTVVIAFAFGSFFADLFDTGASLGFGFVYTALILLYAENHRRGESEMRGPGENVMRGPRENVMRGPGENGMPGGGGPRDRDGGRRDKASVERSVTPAGAVIVGIAQGIAVVPAISRSGSTIAGGVICDFGRFAAIEFAFLMSIPVTLLAVAQDLLKIILSRGGGTAAAAAGAAAANADGVSAAVNAVSAAGPVEMAVGFLAAAITGYFAARFMLTAIRKIKLTWFSLYVGALGVLILLDQFVFGFVFDKFI